MNTSQKEGYKYAINEINNFIGDIDCKNALSEKPNKAISETIDSIREKLIFMDSTITMNLSETARHAIQLQGKIEMLMHARMALEKALKTDEPLETFANWLDGYDDICFKCVHKDNVSIDDPCVTCFKYKYGELTASNYSQNL